MISERTFASLHRDFWRAVMPRSEQMTRILNASRIAVLPIFTGRSNTYNRGLINEAATRLAHSAIVQNCHVSGLSDAQCRSALNEATEFIERFRRGEGYDIADLDANDIAETISIAERLLDMFQQTGVSPAMFVRVPGAGIIDSCDVDATERDLVIEIKAGNRNCRSEDIRQALVYSALLELCGQIPRVRAIEVFNPRLGWRVSGEVDSVLEMSGGKSWGNFRAEFEN